MKMTIKTADDLAAEAAAREVEAEKTKARAYLADTDWMVTRRVETGAEVPADVTQARATAREVLSK